MSVKSRLLKNSSIYSGANVLQQMLAFFLLPLYTRFLTPNDYGIISVVNSVAAFLVILLNLSLYAAVSRFYFDYKVAPDSRERQKLGIDEDGECLIVSVVTVPPDRKVTLNLAAPILFAPETNRALQVILEGTNFSPQTPLPEV